MDHATAVQGVNLLFMLQLVIADSNTSAVACLVVAFQQLHV